MSHLYRLLRLSAQSALQATLLSAVVGCGGDPNIDPAHVSGGKMPTKLNCTKSPTEAKIEHTVKPDPATCVLTPADLVPRLTTAGISIGPQAALTGGIAFFFASWSLCSYNLVNTSTTATSYNLVAVKKATLTANPACITPPGTPIPQSCFASPDLSVPFSVPSLDGCTCQSEMVFINTPIDQEDDISNAANCPATARRSLASGEYYMTLTAPFVNTLPADVFVPVP